MWVCDPTGIAQMGKIDFANVSAAPDFRYEFWFLLNLRPDAAQWNPCLLNEIKGISQSLWLEQAGEVRDARYIWFAATAERMIHWWCSWSARAHRSTHHISSGCVQPHQSLSSSQGCHQQELIWWQRENKGSLTIKFSVETRCHTRDSIKRCSKAEIKYISVCFCLQPKLTCLGFMCWFGRFWVGAILIIKTAFRGSHTYSNNYSMNAYLDIHEFEIKAHLLVSYSSTNVWNSENTQSS